MTWTEAVLGVGSQILRSQGVIEMTKHNTIQFFLKKKKKKSFYSGSVTAIAMHSCSTS